MRPSATSAPAVATSTISLPLSVAGRAIPSVLDAIDPSPAPAQARTVRVDTMPVGTIAVEAGSSPRSARRSPTSP